MLATMALFAMDGALVAGGPAPARAFGSPARRLLRPQRLGYRVANGRRGRTRVHSATTYANTTTYMTANTHNGSGQ